MTMSFLLPNVHQAMLLLTCQIQTCMKSTEIWLFYAHQAINMLNVQMYIKPWKFLLKRQGSKYHENFENFELSNAGQSNFTFV